MAENLPEAPISFGGGASAKEPDRSPSSARRYLFGNFELQPDTGLLLRNGHRIRIQDLPFRMLIVLLESPGAIVSREELRNRLWGDKTFVEFDNNLRVAAAKLREALQDNATQPQFLETIARRGYRFLASVEVVRSQEPIAETVQTLRAETAPIYRESPMPLASATEIDAVPEPPPETDEVAATTKRAKFPMLKVGIAAALLLGVGFGLWRWKHHVVLAATDVVTLGAIANDTGDPALDDAFTLAFRIKMEESPFLHAISSERFERAEMALHNDPSHGLDATASELAACLSVNGNLLLHGRVARDGNAYIVRLSALRCQNGRELTSTEARATSVDALLKSLDQATDAFRLRLGEKPSMLGRFDVPLNQATTDSLAAQRAFRAGEQLHMGGRDLDSRASYKLAVDLDPKFAMAYLQLGRSYYNTGESSAGRGYFQKAFDLRERTTDREKLYIATNYYGYVTGEIDRAIGAYQLWESLYPKDIVPVNNLAIEYFKMGDGQRAVAEARRAIELDPQLPVPYATLSQALMISGDYRTLSAFCNDKEQSKSPAMVIPLTCHELALATGDTATQAMLEQKAQGQPISAYMLNDTAEAEAYNGHLRHARELFVQSVTSAREHQMQELAGVLELNGVAILAVMGDTHNASTLIDDALRNSGKSEQVLMGAAIAWAILGNDARSRELAAQADTVAPNDIVITQVEGPLTIAVTLLNSGHPQEAVERLSTLRAYDFYNILELMPIYYRALGMEKSGDRTGAIAEFERMLTHQSVRPRSVYIPLAKLELAKLYSSQNESERSKQLVRELELLWVHADAGFGPRSEMEKH